MNGMSARFKNYTESDRAPYGHNGYRRTDDHDGKHMRGVQRVCGTGVPTALEPDRHGAEKSRNWAETTPVRATVSPRIFFIIIIISIIAKSFLRPGFTAIIERSHARAIRDKSMTRTTWKSTDLPGGGFYCSRGVSESGTMARV